MKVKSNDDWRLTPDGADYLALVYEAAAANGWSRQSVGSSAGRAKSLEIFKEYSQKYFAPEAPSEDTWYCSKEGARYLETVYDAAAANGWSRKSVGTSVGRAKSLETFKERSQKYFTQKPPKKPRESTWRDTEEGSMYLKSVYESALANGWSRPSVRSTAIKSESLEKFISVSQRYFSQKPPEQPRQETWKDTEEGAAYFESVLEAAKANGWSRQNVFSMACQTDFSLFRESSQKYFAPPPAQTAEEQWGSWIRDQQIASGLPVAYHKSNWSQAWRVSVRISPRKHPDLEQSARAFVAGKLKDLDYLKAIEWAKTDFEGKVRLLMEWLLEGYNNFPVKPDQISNSDGRIDASALRAAVAKVSRKQKWRHLQPLFPATFWTELSHAIQDLEQAEPIAA